MWQRAPLRVGLRTERVDRRRCNFLDMQTVLGILVPLLTFALFGAALVFVANRLIATFGLARARLFRRAWVAAYVLLAVAVLAGATSASPVLGAAYWAGGVALVLMVYLTLAFLVAWLVERAWRVPRRTSGIAALAVAGAATAYGVVHARSFTVDEVEIALPGLARPVTIMHLSDVHVGHHRGRAYLQRVVDETNRRAPDLVAITGDLLDAEVALAPGVLAPLAELRAPVFYVGGNHEQDVDQPRAQRAVAGHGVRVLRNEVAESHGLQIVGLRYMKPDAQTFDAHPSHEKETFASALPKLPVRPDVPAVLLHHSPVGARYAVARGIDLMLAGHTHAGQVFPATLVARLQFPFDVGLHAFETMQVFVSPGVGTFLAPLRVGTTNTITLVRLVPAA